MKNALLALIALPLMCAATAGATVIALKHSAAWLPASPERADTGDVAAPPPGLPASEPGRPTVGVPPDLTPPAQSAPVPPPIAGAPDRVSPAGAALRVVNHLSAVPPEPAAVPPAKDTGDATKGADPSGEPSPEDAPPGNDTIDFLKLSDELHEISQRLERFNQKLMKVINHSDPQRLAPRGTASPYQEEAAP